MNTEAERRHERLLWGEPVDGVAYPTPVIAVVTADYDGGVQQALDDSVAHADDAFWARVVRRFPVTPQGFINWWVARRWLRPRDITKE